MKKLLLAAITCVMATMTVCADDEPKLKLTPTARVLIDGALYASPEKKLFKDGLAIPEARVGVKMSYGKWSSWIDMAFAYGKVGLRNMWIEYAFNKNHSLRFGNYIQPYGYQSTTTLSLKCTFEQPMAAAPFTPGILLGGMYTFKNPTFWAAASFHVESAALTNVMNYPMFTQQGYGLLTRLVWRQKNSGIGDAPILQAGVSAGFVTPQRTLEGNEDVHDGFALAATYPTKVTTLEAVGTNVNNARNLFKFTPELCLAYKRCALEGQYFFQTIDRKGKLPSYISQSGYVTLRTLLTRGQYGYDSDVAMVTHPKKNTLELAIDYNYITLSDSHAGIYGGRANSFNATLNYYFNPYVTARLNYTYTHTWNRTGFDPTTLNGFQARLMVLF